MRAGLVAMLLAMCSSQNVARCRLDERRLHATRHALLLRLRRRCRSDDASP